MIPSHANPLHATPRTDGRCEVDGCYRRATHETYLGRYAKRADLCDEHYDDAINGRVEIQVTN
jgi:hypothetical protein